MSGSRSRSILRLPVYLYPVSLSLASLYLLVYLYPVSLSLASLYLLVYLYPVSLSLASLYLLVDLSLPVYLYGPQGLLLQIRVNLLRQQVISLSRPPTTQLCALTHQPMRTALCRGIRPNCFAARCQGCLVSALHTNRRQKRRQPQAGRKEHVRHAGGGAHVQLHQGRCRHRAGRRLPQGVLVASDKLRRGGGTHFTRHGVSDECAGSERLAVGDTKR